MAQIIQPQQKSNAGMYGLIGTAVGALAGSPSVGKEVGQEAATGKNTTQSVPGGQAPMQLPVAEVPQAQQYGPPPPTPEQDLQQKTPLQRFLYNLYGG